jgi:UDPglucose 6-dehydrogenase
MAVAKNYAARLRIVEAAVAVNNARPAAMVDRMEAAFGPVRDRQVAVLGLTFKPSTDDLRESPALRVIAEVKRRGGAIRAYDPVALAAAVAEDPDLTACADEYDAARGADILVLATEWNQFRNMDLARLKEAMRTPNIADLRNIYEPAEMRELGFGYLGVGR